MSTESTNTVIEVLKSPAIVRLRRWRLFKDKAIRHAMTVGGVSVIIAIVLIFFYLLYVVFPLLIPARIEKVQQFTVPVTTAGPTTYLAIEEKAEIGVRFTAQAHAIFFNLRSGQVITDTTLLLPPDVTITSFARSDPATHMVAYGLSDGRAIVAQHVYTATYAEDNARTLTPQIEYPLGNAPIVVDENGQALNHLAIQSGTDANTVAAITSDNRLVLAGFMKESSFIDESVTLTRTGGTLSLQEAGVTHLLMDKEQSVIYIADKEGKISRVDVKDKTQPQIVQQVRVVEPNQQITALTFLAGDISLLVGDSNGHITQWFPVRDNNNNSLLTKIREFRQQTTAITSITAEERRRGFVAADNTGKIGLYHTTAQRTLLVEPITDTSLVHVTLAPRANMLVAEDNKERFHVWKVDNEHPEVSFSALWGKVWYENYPEPAYIWQSSSASGDFEPKFSLMPLAFGTLKAAFYAMLVAIPLSVLGAIYTAYFMSPSMRKLVKPTIEIMEALPTVILGFLAGLWLAPAIENNLTGAFLLFLFLPVGILGSAYAWRFMPKWITYRVPPGWEAALLIPTIIIISWLAFTLNHPVENWLFSGDMRHWLTVEAGIGFDQRNALIVGIAMGLAVIPNIFSIAEDAVFSVPKHLTVGSLALGATPWQTMTRVVILTASPGIFSAIMIGIGRAVGETMIVLMATGNTPVMDFSIFQGLRTLSANIAVEMPESALNSTHYRILFLSGLVLFIFTFFFNTLAEIVRQRLRRKYSTL